MKNLPKQRTKRWVTRATAGLATFAGGERLVAAPWVNLSDHSICRPASLAHFVSSYDRILGTSLDLIVEAGRPADAAACELQLLAEVERLRRILSTYDSGSEISRVIAGAPIESPELAELLEAYARWSIRTEGVIDVNMAGVIAAWRDAVPAGRTPDRSALMVAAQRPRSFNVDALGKGLIIDHAVRVARRFAPSGLLNIGGDLRAWGDTAWLIGVSDPRRPADNAPALTRFILRDAAVATSGDYARGFKIGSQRFSHLIDPRTQWPAEFGSSATVIAADALTANALSTAAAILGAKAGGDLLAGNAIQGHLIVDDSGAVSQSGLLAESVVDPTRPVAAGSDLHAATSSNWPTDYRVAIKLELKDQGGFRAKRPYVAVWIEDSHGRAVRTVSVWGNKPRWVPELTKWWQKARDSGMSVGSITRASRAPGSYSMEWDGRDDAGSPLPSGDYMVCLEINREHGHHVEQRVHLVCGGNPSSAELHPTAESDASTVTYGPAGR